MNCAECRGACCEELALPWNPPPLGDPVANDIAYWLRLHGVLFRRKVWLEVRCTKLSPEGRCAIYGSRPTVCRQYVPGGEECLLTVLRRRGEAGFERIREERDPPSSTVWAWEGTGV